jgi:hypothetical protein
LNSGDQQARIVASGVSDTDQSLTKIQPGFHLKYSACFLKAAGSSLSLPGEQCSWVFLYLLFNLILVRVNSENQISNKVQPEFHVAHIYSLCICNPTERNRPRNPCDGGDHIASFRGMSFRSLQKEAGFEPPEKHNGYGE